MIYHNIHILNIYIVFICFTFINVVFTIDHHDNLVHSKTNQILDENMFKQLKGCGDICSIQDSGKKSIYYNYIEKNINCESIMTNPSIDASMIGDPPDDIPHRMMNYFLYDGNVAYRKFASKPLHEVYLTSEAQTSIWEYDKIESWKKQCQENRLEGNYGVQSTTALYEVIKRSKIKGSSVAVLGSENPWVEACALAAGASMVTTIEYGKIQSQHHQIQTFTPDQVRQNAIQFFEKFDVIISFSSVEHSGLGRYGDALNPWGDRQAIARAWCMTKPMGYLVLGVPLGNDAIEYNAHRIYGNIQLPHLTANWHQVWQYDKNVDISYNQKPFLLQKRHGTYFNSTLHTNNSIEKKKKSKMKTCQDRIEGPLCFGHMQLIKSTTNNEQSDVVVHWKQPIWNYGNMLGTYWSARLFAYLSGRSFSAQWVTKHDIFSNLPNQLPRQQICDFDLLNYYCKICDRSILVAPIVEYPNECPHIYEPIVNFISNETYHSVSVWLNSLDKKPFFMDLKNYAIIQLRCEILNHIAYGPNAFSIYDNLPYSIEHILIAHPLLPHKEGDPRGFCKPILKQLADYLGNIRPNALIHIVTQSREVDFAAFVMATTVIRESSSTFSLFSSLASSGDVYSSKKKSFDLPNNIGYPYFGENWHWTDTPLMIHEETGFDKNTVTENEVINWLMIH